MMINWFRKRLKVESPSVLQEIAWFVSILETDMELVRVGIRLMIFVVTFTEMYPNG